MKLHLYTDGYPKGRGALLAKQLHVGTSLSGEECLQLVERLFDAQHSRQNPAEVETRDEDSAEKLKELCLSFGISADPSCS
jgi:hypothetical protein